MAKSYYTILGIASDASPREIKSAYRRLAKELHPDRYGGDRGLFLNVQEAYSVLGDPQRRRAYDAWLSETGGSALGARRRRADRAEPEPLIPDEPGAEFPSGLLRRLVEGFGASSDDLFDRFWNNFASLGRPVPTSVRNLTAVIDLSPEQGRRGGLVRVMVPVRAECPACQGDGAVGAYECWRCAGEGAIEGELPVSVAFPAGLEEETVVTVPLGGYGVRPRSLTVIFRPIL